MSPPIKRHLELEIEILQKAPRDANKLERLLKVKGRQEEGAIHIEDTQRLVTEIMKCYGCIAFCEEQQRKTTRLCSSNFCEISEKENQVDPTAFNISSRIIAGSSLLFTIVVIVAVDTLFRK